MFGRVTPYSLVENPQHFGGMCCFNIHGLLLWIWRRFFSSKIRPISVLVHNFVIDCEKIILSLNLRFVSPCIVVQFNKSPTRCNNFSVYYPDVNLQLNMFRAFSRPSSGAQWLQWQPLVLPSYRGDSRAVFVLALWNKRHFEEKKLGMCSMFKILSTYNCWKNI